MEDMTPSPVSVTRQVSISPLDRKPVQRHLVGISAAQQRQQDFLQQEARLQVWRLVCFVARYVPLFTLLHVQVEDVLMKSSLLYIVSFIGWCHMF